jgi:putative copper resistance protein D
VGTRELDRGSRWVWPIALVGAAGIVAMTLAARAAPNHGFVAVGASDPGAAVQIMLTMARLTVDVAASLSVGSLAFVVLLTAPLRADGAEARLSARASAAMQWASRWSRVWQVGAFFALVLAAVNDAGLPLSQMGGLDSWIRTAVDGAESGYWLAAAIGASLVAVLARFARGWRNVAPVLGLATLSLLPPLFAGHASSDTGHDWATAALTLHVPAAALWTGLLVQVVVGVSRHAEIPEGLLRRYQVIAWVCWGVIGSTGVVLGLVLAPPSGPSGAYTMVLAAKIALFLAIGVVGATWRRNLVRRIESSGGLGGPAAALRLLVVEGALLASAFLGSAQMTSLTPPAFTLPVSDLQTLIGYDLPGAPNVWRLAFDWRVEILFLALSLTLAIWYLVLLARVRRSGGTWPWGRTAAWLGGCGVVLVASSSGLGLYEPAMFSVHMVGHMLLAIIAPMLLALGGPLTLAREAVGRGEPGMPDASDWLSLVEDSPAIRRLTHPISALGLLVWSPFVIYFGGIFDSAARFHWAHMLLNLFFLGAGYLFAWAVIGVDRTPRPAPNVARLAMLLAALPFNAVFAGLVMSSHRVLGNGLAAGNMYTALALPWNADLLGDQRLGGLIALVIGEIAVTGAIVSLLVRWWKLEEPLFGDEGLVLRRPDLPKPQAVGDHEER